MGLRDLTCLIHLQTTFPLSPTQWEHFHLRISCRFLCSCQIEGDDMFEVVHETVYIDAPGRNFEPIGTSETSIRRRLSQMCRFFSSPKVRRKPYVMKCLMQSGQRSRATLFNISKRGLNLLQSGKEAEAEAVEFRSSVAIAPNFRPLIPARQP